MTLGHVIGPDGLSYVSMIALTVAWCVQLAITAVYLVLSGLNDSTDETVVPSASSVS